MAQHDYVIANGTGAAVRSDINNGLAAIVSNNSGTSEPATMYAYQWWADTTTGLLKIRNAANNAWVTVGTLASANLGLLPSAGILIAALGDASTPGITFTGDLNTGIYSPGADQVAISTNGTGRLTVGTTAVTSTLPVDVPLGAVGTPSITFTGDLNTGIYSPAADTIAFAEGGVEAMRIDSSGRVGIGVTAPSNALEVSGSFRTFSAANGDVSITHSGLVSTLQAAGSIALAFGSNNAERGRFDTSGRFLVGTSTSIGANSALQTVRINNSQLATFHLGYAGAEGSEIVFSHSRNTTPGSYTIVNNNDALGQLHFCGDDGTKYTTKAASIEAFVDGTPGANDMPGRLVFATTADGASSPTERMRISQNGNIAIGATADNGYRIRIVSSSVAVASFQRDVNDGDLVDFHQEGSKEGSISVSGNTVSYNQFLGSHWAALTDWSRPEIKLGTILETINELTDWKYAVIEVADQQKKVCYNGTAEIGSTVTVEYEGEEYEGILELESDPEFNKAVKVKVNDTAASKAVYGVFVGWNTDSNGDGGVWNDMYVGAVGNYVIRMAAGQEPEIGDLVEADGTGCAVVQDDDIIRTKTVAKITSIIPQVTYDDGSFLVTCVLYCG
jgi:hypothetical protein